VKIISAEFIVGAVNLNNAPKLKLPEIAFAGRSNVGKSSLINCILNLKNLAKTSSTPGKTQQLNFYKINQKFYFVDLPGYGFAKVSQEKREGWKKLIESYLENNSFLKSVVLIIDSRHEPMELDIAMAEWLNFLNIPYIISATKIDKLSNNDIAKNIKKFKEAYSQFHPLDIIKFSAITKEGKVEIWKCIESFL
jgi:GTP-binding protein